MLPGWFIVFSIALRLFSGGRYTWGVIKGRARPNVVTWFLWGLTPMIAFAASLGHGLNGQSLMLLALGISPLVISIVAVKKTGLRQHLTPFTMACAGIAILGIVLWMITDNPAVAIIFSILADIAASLPTLKKAYDDPSSEYPLPYLLSIVGMVITILCIVNWSFITYAFPVYMLCINIALYAFAAFPLKATARRVRLVALAAAGKA